MITCEASNTELSMPSHSSLQLDLILAPLSVDISASSDPVHLGDLVTLTCSVTGARPVPDIHWIGDYHTQKDTQYKVRSHLGYFVTKITAG